MLRNAALTSLVLAASLARAGLSNMRATIPGSIHQCASSNVFFFDTNDSGSKTLLFVSPEDASNLGPGQLTLSTVLSSITPLQKIDGINSADAAEFDFTVDLAENVAFSTLGFLSDGTGKNMNLDRTVMQPLPDAPNCLAGNNNAAAAADVQVASSSSSSAAPVVAASSSSSPPPSSSTTPAPAPTTTSVKAAATPSSSTEYASRFVTSTKPKATSSAASVATSAAAISASLSLPPASSSTNATATATSGNATAPAAAATSPVVVQAKFLLTSFIEISNDKTSDGTVSSSVIKGGQVVGAVNGTILPIGNVLYAPNSTAVLSSNSSTSSAANATAQAQTMLLSTSYTLTTEEGESVFVMAQTPLAQNFTTETLLMDFQSSESNSTLFSNITVLGKAETINATMFRIDAYYLNDASA